MKPGKALEPQLAVAEERYATILASIQAYAQFCDAHGDDDNAEYDRLATQLQTLIGKDISRFNLREWWEEEGAEVLAFRIALPDPVKLDGVGRPDIAHIVARIGRFELPEKDAGEPGFHQTFSAFLDDYYHAWLILHCKTYHYKNIFGAHNDKDGKRFWLTDDEKVDLLWPHR
ncbi:hypothetical protein [Janthinobacterium lividum]|uniref:hypothetical protein n=1 Tax=Janthinobacterium lividum TaxID=29581 RepID=UPI001408AD43|nr:hypothetical protein [Janthinobacterium lividum]NHQ91296.1 hypothetical protein [Janthinobacterium lividum]